jgi:hypothetical protein
VAELPAGWQPDPTGRHSHRYWDGGRWTDHVADAGAYSIDPYVEPEPPSVLTWRPPPPVERPVGAPEPVDEPASRPAPEPFVPSVAPERIVRAADRPAPALAGWGAPRTAPPPPRTAPAAAPTIDPEAAATAHRKARILFAVGTVLVVVAVLLLLTKDSGDGSSEPTGSRRSFDPSATVPTVVPDAAAGPDGPPADDLLGGRSPVAGITPDQLQLGLGLTDEQAVCVSQALALATHQGADTTDPQVLADLFRGCDADPSSLESPP